MPNTIPVPYTEDTIVIDVPLDGLLELPVRARTTTVQDLPVIVTKAAHRIRQSIPIVYLEDEVLSPQLRATIVDEYAVTVARIYFARKRLL